MEACSLLLRPVDQHDASALVAFYNGLSQATIRMFRPLGTMTSLEVCHGIVAENELSPASRFDLVACDHGVIAGWSFLAGLNTNHPGLGIAVADRMQGQGVGPALLTRIVRFALERGLAAIYLTVVQDNRRAIELYQRYGFVTYDEQFDEADRLPYFHMVAHIEAAVPAD